MTCEKTSQSKGSIYSWSFWVAIPSRLLSYCVQEKIFKLYKENSFLWCHQWPFILLFQNLAHINSLLNNVHFYIYLNWRFIFINALKQKCTLLEINKKKCSTFFLPNGGELKRQSYSPKWNVLWATLPNMPQIFASCWGHNVQSLTR